MSVHETLPEMVRRLEAEIADLTRERDEARAASAAIRDDMDRALRAMEDADYDTVRYWLAPVDDTDTPGQAILDELARLRARDATWCMALVAHCTPEQIAVITGAVNDGTAEQAAREAAGDETP